MILELFGWVFFNIYYKRKGKAIEMNHSTSVHTGIVIYIFVLGIPMLWDWFNVNFSLLDNLFDVLILSGRQGLAIAVGFIVPSVIFAIYLVGLFSQFKTANGIIYEFMENT